MSERITYCQLKPFCLPTSLDDLSGPHTGSLRLPIHLCWSPGDHVFDLARLGDALTVYQCVIAEGTTQEQHEYLNHALLIELWPHLHLDVRIIAAWENTFDSLRGKTNGGASTPHPRTRTNSIPVAQECTPPASLCRGFRHTRATIGDVGKPRAIRQNTLVGGSSRCCGMGGRVRSHRSCRRPVRWRSGPTCAQVNPPQVACRQRCSAICRFPRMGALAVPDRSSHHCPAHSPTALVRVLPRR